MSSSIKVTPESSALFPAPLPRSGSGASSAKDFPTSVSGDPVTSHRFDARKGGHEFHEIVKFRMQSLCCCAGPEVASMRAGNCGGDRRACDCLSIFV